MQLFNVTLLMGFCVMLAATKSSHGQFVCPPFWVPFQESCYRIFGTKLSWTAAEESCNTHFNGFTMGHLVSIKSEAENRFVWHLWNSSTGGMAVIYAGFECTYWIGLTDEGHEGRWVWTDNNEVATYTRWGSSEPSNVNDQNCVHQWKRDGNWLTWNDMPCGRMLYYVCELPQFK